MKNLIISLSILAMLTNGSCAKKEAADLVIINGNVLTIDSANPSTQALAIRKDSRCRNHKRNFRIH
jgi:hypothetical protein